MSTSAVSTYAQTMETFESVVATPGTKPTSFVSNNQAFTITTDNCFFGSTFGVFVPANT